MFYVAIVILFSVFSYLLWKSNLLVCYKLNRFRTPQVNQFDICALLFGGYVSFIPLDKWSYKYIENLPSGGSSLSQLALKLFPLCDGLLL